MMSDKSLLDGGMLPGVLQDSGEEATDMAWHGMGWVDTHAGICALQTDASSQTTSRCQTDRPSQNRRRWTILWTSIPRYALQHPDPP
jgi:hypothetical protein